MSNTPFDPRRLADMANRFAPKPAAPASHAATPAPQAPAAVPAAPASVPVGSPATVTHPAGSCGDVDAGGDTGHARVDAALAELARAGSLPPQEQIAAYESVHRTLQETLRSIEQN